MYDDDYYPTINLSEDLLSVEGPEITIGGGAGICPKDLILCSPPLGTISSLIDLFLDLLCCVFLAEFSSTCLTDADLVLFCGTDCNESS